MEQPLVLLVDFEIDEISQMTKALDKLVKFNQPVVMFCRHIEQKPLSQVIYNFGIKKIDISVVSMGSAGSDYITSILGDLGALLDARVFDMFDLDDFENLDYGDLGRAQKIEVKSMESFILSKTDKNESHKANLKNRIEQILFDYNSSGGKSKMILEQRLA
jgi:chaperonin GroEL